MPLSIEASSNIIKNQLTILNELQSKLSPSSQDCLTLSQSRPDIIRKITHIHQNTTGTSYENYLFVISIWLSKRISDGFYVPHLNIDYIPIDKANNLNLPSYKQKILFFTTDLTDDAKIDDVYRRIDMWDEIKHSATIDDSPQFSETIATLTSSPTYLNELLSANTDDFDSFTNLDSFTDTIPLLYQKFQNSEPTILQLFMIAMLLGIPDLKQI